jgi:hypothetical protein
MSPISVTTIQPSVSTVSAQALHQLPTVITKPKVMVTNAAQMVLNGPSHTLSNSSLTNGAHAEIKKENNLPAFSLGRFILSSYKKSVCSTVIDICIDYHVYEINHMPLNT